MLVNWAHRRLPAERLLCYWSFLLGRTALQRHHRRLPAERLLCYNQSAMLDTLYLIVTGAVTARRVPELLPAWRRWGRRC